MNADEHGYFDWLTECALGAIFEVSNTLGAGFLEKVYQRALLTELRLRGIRAIAEASFTVAYKGHSVGEYFADLLVEDVLVIELKCVERLCNEHTRNVSTIYGFPVELCVFSSISGNRKSNGSESSMVFRFPEPIEALLPTQA
jgi:GxxExxY protein